MIPTSGDRRLRRSGPWAGVLRYWWPVAVLATVTGFLQLGGPGFRQHLAYARAAWLEGEPWRLFTAHLVHLGWAHWALNVAALAVIWAGFGRQLLRPCLALVLGGAAVGVGLGLAWLSPAVGGYVGLSGVLHGLFAAAGVWTLSQRMLLGVVLLSGLGVKLGAEQMLGAAPASQALVGAPVIVDAHLYGAAAGALVAAACALGSRRPRPIGPSG